VPAANCFGRSAVDLPISDRPKAGRFATYLEGREALLISAIEIYEVYKVIRRDLSEERRAGQQALMLFHGPGSRSRAP
jgi:hypothetical protein